MPRRKKKPQNVKTEEVQSPRSDCENEEDILLGVAKNICQLKSTPQVGRYLVARKNLKQGEAILTDKPLVVGPCQETKTVCIGCCRLTNTDISSAHRCGGCGWPVCGGGCTGLTDMRQISVGGHSPTECNLLKTYTEPLTPSSFNIVTPLRCLLLQNEDPELWHSLIRMESHNDIRRKIPNIWTRNQTSVVDPIRKLTDQFSEKLIHTICGICEVNCFSVGEDGVDARALYPTAYLLLHDCTPNTNHIDSERFVMTVRAAVDIPRGVAITLSYTSTLYDTVRRRRELKESKFFDCCCPRCSSSTELGTYLNGVKCPHCNDGWLIPSEPLVLHSQWKCGSCQQHVHNSHPVNITERSSSDFESLKDPSISDYEKLMNKYKNVLHPNHSTLVRVKYALSQMYGKTEGYLLGEMSKEMLQNKYDLCKELLDVLDIIEPGISKIRGVTMYESHAPLLLLTQYKAASGELTNKEVKRNLRKVRALLAESVVILSLERPDSSEGVLCEFAKQALEQAKSWPI